MKMVSFSVSCVHAIKMVSFSVSCVHAMKMVSWVKHDCGEWWIHSDYGELIRTQSLWWVQWIHNDCGLIGTTVTMVNLVETSSVLLQSCRQLELTTTWGWQQPSLQALKSRLKSAWQDRKLLYCVLPSSTVTSVLRVNLPDSDQSFES